jgi:hypothetical protein
MNSRRLFIAGLIGLIAFSLAAQTTGIDFAGRTLQPLRELISGHDPYLHQFTWLDVPYPLPAMLIGLPFLPLADNLAGALFIGFTSALLAMTLTRNGQYWRLLIFVSYPFIESVITVQYAPLMALALVLPSTCAWPLMLIKPQVALAGMAMDKPTRRSIFVTAIGLLISLIVIPLWPLEWAHSIVSYQSLIPILLPFGFVMLLAVIRWRDRVYRGLFVLAALPKRGMYDHLFVGLLARDAKELLLYIGLSWLMLFVYAPVLLYLTPLCIWL